MNTAENLHYLPGHEPSKAPEKERSIQVEDGYTRIANELYEAVNNAHTCPVTLRQLRVVHAVMRRTYGYQKKFDRISDSQIAGDTGLSRQNVNKAKKELLAFGVLSLDGSKIGLNKHVEQWNFDEKPEKNNLIQSRDSVSKAETKSVSKSGSHKRKKETLTTDVVRDAPKTNRQRVDLNAFADQVSIETLQAFSDHRRAVRSPLTQRALELTVMSAIKASEALGITADQAINEAIEAGWKTVRTEWLQNRGVSGKESHGEGSVMACPHADILAIWDEVCGSTKGRAPNMLDWKGTRSAEALAERWAEFYAADGSGRYSSVEDGLKWWRLALSTIAGKQNFQQSDASIWDLFYKTRFSKAANGKLPTQGGAVR